MAETAGFAEHAGALRARAETVRALGEHQTADLAARTRALAVSDGSFGDAAVLAGLPKAYDAAREDVADHVTRAADALIAAAQTLDELAARYRQAEEDSSLRPGPGPR